MHAFYQHPLSCARASNPLTRWFSHPRRKQRGIENLFRKSHRNRSAKRIDRKLMSANATDASNKSATAQAQAPVPKKIVNAQTVCNEKNEKGKLCNGHLKQLQTGGEPSEVHLRGDDVLFKCQACGTLYMGPPLGHVRDPFKQQRFVENELAAILQAAGGTLPAIVKNDKGVFVLKEETTHHAPAPAAAKPTTTQAAATADRKQLAETQASKSAP